MMNEVMVGAKYDSKKYGMVIVMSIDSKTKTVRFHKVNSEKQEIPLTESSFKRSFKLVDAGEAKPAEKKAVTTEKAQENVSTKSPEKSEKKAKPKAEKKQKAGLSEAEREIFRDQMIAYFKKLNVDASVSEKYPMWVNVKFSDKNVFGIGLNPTSIRIRALSQVLPKSVEFKSVKGGFDATVNFGYENKNEMYDMFKYAVENFKDSDEVKRKRQVKEPKAKEKQADK